MKIARVFPRRTNATPDDALAFTTPPPKILPDIDEVHISVAFTYDIPKAEQLAEAWHKTGLPVKMGGPAFNEAGGDFIPGLYMKKGYVITSRGCPNRCWFCSGFSQPHFSCSPGPPVLGRLDTREAASVLAHPGHRS